MELRHLRYFVATAQELSFTKAALRLRVAQPALSRQIRQLEDEIGAKLLERDQRGTHLTEAGRVFLTEACGLLEQCDRAVQAARNTARAASGRLNIGYVWALFHSVVPEAIGRFRQLLPDVAVNLFDLTGLEQAQALLDGGLDAAFIGFEPEAAAAGLARRKVGSCAFMAALPQNHRAARKREAALSDLARDSFIMISEQTYPGASKAAFLACERAGFRPKVAQTVERGFTILGLVASNGGVALLPASLRNLPHPGVVFRPLTEPPEADLYVAWKAAGPQSVRDTFLNSLGGV